MNKKTLTIGIAAFNEEQNIESLLRSVLSQRIKNVSLNKVILSSDGSTDHTVLFAKRIKDPRVKIINNNNRSGIARGLNQIVSQSKDDILVTLDADINIYDRFFLQKLIEPVLRGRTDLTSAAITERLPKTFYGKIIYVSMLLKNILFKTYKDGNNVYTCHGLARAYSKRFFKSLHFPTSIGNDMYSYLKCVSETFRYQYTPKAVAWYKVPENYGDHTKQSTRFFYTITEQKKHFDSNFVDKETRIPEKDYLIAAFKSLPILLNFPVHSSAYFFLQLYLKLKSRRLQPEETWSIAVSTKKI